MKRPTAAQIILTLWSLALLCAVAVILSGCASFHTTQSDIETPTTNGIVRATKTEASARALLAAKQTLAGWQAKQSAKTQGASIGGIEQESDASRLIAEMTALAQAIGALQAGPAAGLFNRSAPAASSLAGPQFYIPDNYDLVRRPTNREVPPGFEVVPVRPRPTPPPLPESP